MRKLVAISISVGCVVAAWTIGPAFASSLSRTSKTLGASNVSIPRCDADGVSPVFVLSGSNVTSVTVSGIASTCGGKTLNLTLTNGTTTVSGSAAVPGGGGSVSVTLSGSIPVTNPNVLQTEMSVI